MSGGRDSVALCHALKTAGRNVVAINVEHGIRGENSVSDSLFVQDFCNKNGIRLFSFAVDAPAFCKQNGYTLEQGARILRYEIFAGLLKEQKCDYIALAHHLDDQAETVFMRILRGTGIKGLEGMKELSGRYIRPLLSCDREAVNAYIESNSLAYVDDETNLCTDFTRNFLRRELLALKERFPSMLQSVARLTRNAAETEDFVQSAMHPLRLENGEVYIPLADLENPLLAKKYIVEAAKMLGQGQDVEERHFPPVLSLSSAQNGKRVELAHGICCHKNGEYVVMTAEKDCAYIGQIPFRTGIFEDFGVRVDFSCKDEFEKTEKGKGVLFVDADKIPKGAVIRHRKDGDFINKFGGGRKSLGDFLTDKKVPLRHRDELALVAKDGEIFAVFGIEISKDCAVSDGGRVLKLSLIGKSEEESRK